MCNEIFGHSLKHWCGFPFPFLVESVVSGRTFPNELVGDITADSALVVSPTYSLGNIRALTTDSARKGKGNPHQCLRLRPIIFSYLILVALKYRYRPKKVVSVSVSVSVQILVSVHL